jgi:hypothetical protein
MSHKERNQLNWKTFLFSWIGWQIEHENRQKGDADAGDDDVDGVEQRLSTQRQVEDDILKHFGFLESFLSN